MYSRARMRCIYCGHSADQIDHIQPRCDGGSDEESNLAPACKSCNCSKGGRSVEQFLRGRPEILMRLRDYQAGKDVFSGLVPHKPPRSGDVKSAAVTLRVSVRMHDRLRNMAFKQRVSQHSLLIEALNLLFERHGRPLIPI